MRAPHGPNIVPNLPAPVGTFNNALNPGPVISEIVQCITADEEHTQTALDQTLRPHYMHLIRRQLEDAMSREEHRAIRAHNQNEIDFATNVLQEIKNALQSLRFEDFKSRNIRAAVDELITEYNAHPLGARLSLPISRTIERLLDHFVATATQS